MCTQIIFPKKCVALCRVQFNGNVMQTLFSLGAQVQRTLGDQ